MANDWIPMRIDLFEDPAVIEMACRMNVRPEVVVGYCHRIWSWMSRQMRDNFVTGVTLQSLGAVTNLDNFPELMRDVGWLEESTNDEGRPVLSVPNFDRWLSNTAKTRVGAAVRKSRQRQKEQQSVTKMSRSDRDKSVTREEKRREELNTPYSPPQGTFDADDVVTSDDDNKRRQPYPPDFEAWWELYPRKVGKSAALKQFKRHLKTLRSVHGESAKDYLHSRTREFAKSQVGQSEFCPHPSTWLSQGRYDDDPSQWQGKSPGTDLGW